MGSAYFFMNEIVEMKGAYDESLLINADKKTVPGHFEFELGKAKNASVMPEVVDNTSIGTMELLGTNNPAPGVADWEQISTLADNTTQQLVQADQLRFRKYRVRYGTPGNDAGGAAATNVKVHVHRKVAR